MRRRWLLVPALLLAVLLARERLFELAALWYLEQTAAGRRLQTEQHFDPNEREWLWLQLSASYGRKSGTAPPARPVH